MDDGVVNHCSDDVDLWTSVFYGQWAWMIYGCLCWVVFVMAIGPALGVDFLSLLVFSAMPLLGSAIFVTIFINNRPPSYFLDLCKSKWFDVLSWAYVRGYISVPPTIWRKRKKAPSIR